MDWVSIVTIVGSVTAIVGFFFNWMNGNITRLDNDVKSIVARMDVNTAASNARMDMMGQRIDDMGMRIDTTQQIIMRMLENRGK